MANHFDRLGTPLTACDSQGEHDQVIHSFCRSYGGIHDTIKHTGSLRFDFGSGLWLNLGIMTALGGRTEGVDDEKLKFFKSSNVFACVYSLIPRAQTLFKERKAKPFRGLRQPNTFLFDQ